MIRDLEEKTSQVCYITLEVFVFLIFFLTDTLGRHLLFRSEVLVFALRVKLSEHFIPDDKYTALIHPIGYHLPRISKIELVTQSKIELMFAYLGSCFEVFCFLV